MKIAIIGYSGAGKSTLATRLGEYYGCEVLYLDSVRFAPDWVERSDEEMSGDVRAFMEKESWIIEGNYSRILYRERMEDADLIIFMNLNRLSCMRRAYKRYRTYKYKTRPDRAEGCHEKFDLKFARWILWNGRSKRKKSMYKNTVESYAQKTVILKNQQQIDRFLEKYRVTGA